MYYMYSSLKCVAMVDTLITKIAAHEWKKKRLKSPSDIVGGSSVEQRGICLFKVNAYLSAFCWHKGILRLSELLQLSPLYLADA